jgi:hypothetical protein
MKNTHHCHHSTCWSSNGDDLKPKETWRNAPKTTRSRSPTSSDRFARSLRSHKSLHNLKGKQQDIFGYLEYPWSYASKFQWIKNQVNRRFLQADMAELPNVARSEIFWTACKRGNKMAIAPSFGIQLRWICTRWKGNFIKFSMEQYFGICSVMYTGENPRKRGSNNTMRTR